MNKLNKRKNLGQFPEFEHEWEPCKTLRLPQKNIGRVKLSTRVIYTSENPLDRPWRRSRRRELQKGKKKKRDECRKILPHRNWKLLDEESSLQIERSRERNPFVVCPQRNSNTIFISMLCSLEGNVLNPRLAFGLYRRILQRKMTPLPLPDDRCFSVHCTYFNENKILKNH